MIAWPVFSSGSDLLGGVDRDREADAAVGLRRGRDLRVDADDAAARIEQRAAGVAGVDRGVGLHDVVDREVVGRLDRATERGDDARRQRALQPERAADRDRRLADLQAASRSRASSGVSLCAAGSTFTSARSVDWSTPSRARSRARPVLKRTRHGLRAVDDVVVREDVAVAVEHEARAGRRRPRRVVTSTETTPGLTRSYSAETSVALRAGAAAGAAGGGPAASRSAPRPAGWSLCRERATDREARDRQGDDEGAEQPGEEVRAAQVVARSGASGGA